MKTKYVLVPALTLLASCAWTQRQTDGAMSWADRNMPTFDSKPGNSNMASNSSSGGLIPDHYNGYPYNSALPRTPMTTAGISGVATPPLPGYQVAPAGVRSYSSNGMTPAQTTSAAEGGNSRQNQAAYSNGNSNINNSNNNGNSLHVGANNAAAYMPSSPAANMPAAGTSTGRRVPSGMLPPSAIQPAPYGQQQPAKIDDFPAEYKNSGNSGSSGQDAMIPPPPI